MKLHEPTFGEEEIAAAVDVMRSTMVTMGDKVREFENAFRPGSVACNSGSSANLLAISALVATGRLKAGDEVIVSALSWSTTVWPIIQCGLVPVIVDCDLDTLNIDPNEVERAIGPKTRALMPVHVYGNPCDMGTLQALALQSDLILIEDCCESMGATYGGNPIGTIGDIATFSTYFSLHITTFEGGFACTDDPELADMMRIQRSHGWTRDVPHHIEYPGIDPRFTFVELGYNLRLTEVAAAIGLVQLPKLAGIVQNRRNMHRFLREEVFGRFDWWRLQKEQPGGKSSCFGFTMVVEDGSPISRGTFVEVLNSYRIETRPIICGNIALQPGIKKYKHRVVGDLKNATKVMQDGLSIGCHGALTGADDQDLMWCMDYLMGYAHA